MPKVFRNTTLFKRLIISYTVVVAVSLGAVSMVLPVLVERYYFSAKEKELIQKGSKIAETIAEVYQYDKSLSSFNPSWMDMMNRSLGARVFIVDGEGTIIAGMHRMRGRSMRLDFPDLDKVFEGKTVVDRGYLQGLNQVVITVALPVRYGQDVIGALLLNSPVADLKAAVDSVRQLIYHAAVIATLVAGISGYIFSRSISGPLHKMSKVTLEMAKGNFDQRVEVDSRDEIGQLAENFNHLAASLKELEQMRKDLIANVSHELRTPLTSIRAYTEALLDGVVKDDSTRKSYLELIHSETLRLNRLIQDLMDLSLIESGKNIWNMKSFNINEAILLALERLKPQVEAKKLQVALDLEDNLPEVYGDRDRILQVLLNLVNNAIQFTPQGGRIGISSVKQQRHVKVSVLDTGRGIPEGEIPYIWERFYRVEKSRNRSLGGTGLGLAIAKGIVEAHGGNIWVESKMGEGSVFSFILPLKGNMARQKG